MWMLRHLNTPTPGPRREDLVQLLATRYPSQMLAQLYVDGLEDNEVKRIFYNQLYGGDYNDLRRFR